MGGIGKTKGTKFIQLVSLCIEKFKDNNEANRIGSFCDGFSEHLHQKARLYKQQDMAPISIILSLYAADLHIDKKFKYSHFGDYSRFEILLRALVHEEIQSLIDSWHICRLLEAIHADSLAARLSKHTIHSTQLHWKTYVYHLGN